MVLYEVLKFKRLGDELSSKKDEVSHLDTILEGKSKEKLVKRNDALYHGLIASKLASLHCSADLSSSMGWENDCKRAFWAGNSAMKSNV